MNNASSPTTGSSQLDAYLEGLGLSYDELLYYTGHRRIGNTVGVLLWKGENH